MRGVWWLNLISRRGFRSRPPSILVYKIYTSATARSQNTCLLRRAIAAASTEIDQSM
jgi:hypothetical protein